MDKLEKYIHDFPEGFTADQIVSGAETHPRLSIKTYEVPEYIKQYSVIDYFFEIMYVIEGKAVISLNGRSYVLKKGDLAFVKDGVKHYEAYVDRKTGYELVWFVYDNVKKLGVINTRFEPSAGFQTLSCFTLKMSSDNYDLLEKIYNSSKNPKDLKETNLLINKWIGNVRMEVEKGKCKKTIYNDEFKKRFALNSKRIQKAVEYIKLNYKKALTLENIARQVSLSPAYFCALFNEAYNNTPFELITDLRLHEAYELLKGSALNVNQIAYKVGYTDATLFRHIFKKYTGISPKEYRERNIEFNNVYSPDDDLYIKKPKT